MYCDGNPNIDPLLFVTMIVQAALWLRISVNKLLKPMKNIIEPGKDSGSQCCAMQMSEEKKRDGKVTFIKQATYALCGIKPPSPRRQKARVILSRRGPYPSWLANLSQAWLWWTSDADMTKNPKMRRLALRKIKKRVWWGSPNQAGMPVYASLFFFSLPQYIGNETISLCVITGEGGWPLCEPSFPVVRREAGYIPNYAMCEVGNVVTTLWGLLLLYWQKEGKHQLAQQAQVKNDSLDIIGC